MKFKKNFFIWLGIILIVTAVFDSFQRNIDSEKITFSEFLNQVDEGQVKSANIYAGQITAEKSDGKKLKTFAPNYPDLVERLEKTGVDINAEPDISLGKVLLTIFVNSIPLIILIAIWIFIAKQMKGGSGRAMGFGRSKAKLIMEKDIKVRFGDVAGIDEAKEELTEMVSFLKNPAKFQALGGRIPRGCLLVGAPGTGKTLLAKAIAGEAGVPFFSISGSDFVEMFVGVGASRVRDMFQQARKSSPCIIFIDEIDAVGRHRGYGIGGGNDEREQTLNQLLVEMDGFEEKESTIVIAATNRPDVLDKALLRPGRFDRQISIPLPDIKGREEILSVHVKKLALSPDVDTKVVARGTPGFSGAELANLVNEAALIAARRNRTLVIMDDFEYARDKVMMGLEKKSSAISENEKKLIAYHEAGHAIVGLNTDDTDPIHKATIIQRGRALGMVMRLPESDEFLQSITKLKSRIAVYMGGRVAEELIFGKDQITGGASSDIEGATMIARDMVMKLGMSAKIGTVLHNNEKDEISEQMSNLIDDEIKQLVEEGYKTASKILNDKKEDLHKLAEALIEFETLSGEEINEILAGGNLRESRKRKAEDEKKNKRSSFSFAAAHEHVSSQNKESSNDNVNQNSAENSNDSKKTTDNDIGNQDS